MHNFVYYNDNYNRIPGYFKEKTGRHLMDEIENFVELIYIRALGVTSDYFQIWPSKPVLHIDIIVTKSTAAKSRICHNVLKTRYDII